jgi:uncharacterized delta-60 repeat protein
MRRQISIVTTTIAVALAAMLALVPAALAASGALDASFGTGGRLTVNPGGDFGGFNAVAIQPDGKIVLAGWASAGPDTEMAITRLNADGSPDTTFGTGGTTLINYSGNPGLPVFDIASAVALQADGKIVVAGQTSSGSLRLATVVRLDPDGSLDPSFQNPGQGAPGIVPVRIGSANAVAVEPSGEIVFAGGGRGIGQTQDNSFVDRLNSDGSTDPTLNQFLDLGGEDDFNGLALQPDGRIIAVGLAQPGGQADADESAVRILDEGQLDTTFGTAGVLTFGLPGGSDDAGNAVAIQPDGSIDVAGGGGAGGDFTFARLTPFGNLDPSLNGGAPLTIDFGDTGDSASAIAPLVNGKVMLGGVGNLDFAAARLQPDGVLDSTFGSGGQVTISFTGENSQANGMAVQPDGRVVLAGIAGNSAAVVRLLGDPASTGGASAGGGTQGPGSAGAGPGSGRLGARALRCDGKRATIVGTNGKDRLRGTRHADVIVGLGGNDTISGLGGNDTICGGRGTDKLTGGSGNDYISGGPGNDHLSGGAGKDDLLGGVGNDNLRGGPGNDTLNGGPGKDKLNGGHGHNITHH